MDESFVRRAVESADINAVRMALLTATGDEQLAAMKPVRAVVRGGAGITYALPAEDREIVIAKAVKFLLTEAPHHTPRTLDDDELRAMMENAAGGEPLTDEQFGVRRSIPAFDKFPHFQAWQGPPPPIPEGFHVAIIGAGFSGVAMAVQLEQLGLPYTIYERRFELGGTWSINTYPDARVDTASSNYEYSFEKAYPWSEHFAKQAEVKAYIEHVARKYGVYEHIRFNHDVKAGAFDAASCTWTLEVADEGGERHKVKANFVVSASGLFASPRDLEIEGVETFGGEIVHSTEWSPERHTASGKAVAVIGNGSTGVQLLGRVAEEASQVHVFQRTPQWITPRENYGDPITPEARWILTTMPYLWNWSRYTGAMPNIDLYAFFVPDPQWQAAGGQFNARNDALRDFLKEYIKQQVDGRQDLIEQLTPDYPVWSRRMIVDNKWYRALLRDNVELVTTPISKITPTGVLTTDGQERPVDMIISAVGFAVEKYVWPADYVGLDGVHLQDRWDAEGVRAYLGMMVHGFPNFFMMYGPNSQNLGAGGGGLQSQMETWTGYIARMIMTVLESGAGSIDVQTPAFNEHNRQLDEAASGLIWMVDETSRERNYYVINGRLQVNSPFPSVTWHKMLTDPRFEDFDLSAPGGRRLPAVVGGLDSRAGGHR